MDLVEKRIAHFDVFKGILIILVVMKHVVWMAKGVGIPVGDSWLSLDRFGSMTFVSFYMPAFFLVAGICSSYGKDLEIFIKNKILALLWPMLVFSNSDNWFLWAMFTASVEYWFLNKFVKKTPFLLMISLLLAFVACNDSLPNPFFIRHAFLLCVFLAIGAKLKDYLSNNRILALGSIIFLVVDVALVYLGYRIPAVFSSIKVDLAHFPIYLLLSITGSMLLMLISKCIKTNLVLEFLGRNSLVIYLVHLPIMSKMMKFADSLGICSNSVAMYFSFVVFTLCCCAIMAMILNKRYLRVLIGKF